MENAKLAALYRELDEIYHLRCIGGLLDWDQQVMLPERGGAGRAAQRALIARLMHARFTAAEFVSNVYALRDSADSLAEDDRVNVLEIARKVERRAKLPPEFVSERSLVASEAYDTWIAARPRGSFAAIEPLLARLIELARREADLVGYSEHPYDALLDYYEPGARLRQIKPLLLELGEELRGMVPKLAEKFATAPEPSSRYSEDEQRALCLKILEDVGYELTAGRLDRAVHPFQSSLGPYDVRVTTRYDQDNYLSSIYTTLHEAGHALYEQGLPVDQRARPLGSPVSLGIHESQSRIWENMIGRSRAFARYLHRVLIQYLPTEHQATDPESLWMSVNRVSPSLIRVEADEVTYSLHIVIRMLLEEQMLIGDLDVAELPEAWDEMYERYLGVRAPGAGDGVLQDVHWYSGAIGYFPTYALGNLHSAAMLEVMQRDEPRLWEGVEEGDFAPVLGWLRRNVHAHGMRYTAAELFERIAGRPLEIKPFVSYLCQKFADYL